MGTLFQLKLRLVLVKKLLFFCNKSSAEEIDKCSEWGLFFFFPLKFLKTDACICTKSLNSSLATVSLLKISHGYVIYTGM